MNRHEPRGNAQPLLIALLLAASLASPSLLCAAQAPAVSAQPHASIPAPSPISGLLQPALDTVRQTLESLRIDRWKKGTVRDEASANIDSIRTDLRTNMPPLLQSADAAPGSVSKLLPLSRHLNALYDVLLRISEASRVAAPDDQAAELQQALLSLSNARLSLDDRMRGWPALSSNRSSICAPPFSSRPPSVPPCLLP